MGGGGDLAYSVYLGTDRLRLDIRKVWKIKKLLTDREKEEKRSNVVIKKSGKEDRREARERRKDVDKRKIRNWM